MAGNIMNRLALVVLLAGISLVAPLADAQQQSVLVLALQPPMTTLNGDSVTLTGGTITYITDATVLANTAGVPVSYVITKLPTWASAVVSPSQDVFFFGPQPSLSYQATKSFVISIAVPRDAPADAFGVIEITATVMPTMFAAKYATAKAQIPIRLVNTLAPCDHPTNSTPTLAPPSPASAPASTEPAPVHVQSAAPATTMPTTAMALGGFGAVGAGVGFLVRKRV